MAVYSYIGYAPDALSFFFGDAFVSVNADYDPATDRVNITVDDAATSQIIGGRADNGIEFDGDSGNDEAGDDLTQDGVITELDGTQIAAGATYLEQAWTLTPIFGATVPTITLYAVEVEGVLVGYIPSEPLVEGVFYSTEPFNVVPTNAPDTSDPDALSDVPCFVAGTRIATPAGDVAVEDIRAGDAVRCADGATATVVWAGRRAVLPAFLSDADLWPIEIAASALGPGVPARPLRVSPNHRIALSGPLCEMLFGQAEVLMPAKFLLNLPGVSWAHRDGPVTYCHFLCDRHRIVLANGAPSESLHPGDIALGAFHADARAEVLRLFPELATSGLASYGPTAAPVLRRPEAAVLTAALGASA